MDITSGMTGYAQTRTFRLAIRAPDNGHSLSAIFPVFPSHTGHFGKEQSGTGFGNAGARDGSRHDRLGDCPAKGSFVRRQVLSTFPKEVAQPTMVP